MSLPEVELQAKALLLDKGTGKSKTTIDPQNPPGDNKSINVKKSNMADKTTRIRWS